MAIALGNDGKGIAFLVSAGLVYEIIAFACSSPQTAEINIRKRESTLMKYVYMGEGLSAVTVAFAAIIDKKHRQAIIAGGIFAMASSYAMYAHARSAGMNNQGPETEQY